MHRLTTSLRSIAGSRRKFQESQYLISGRLELLQTSAARSGHGSSGYEMRQVMSSVQMEIVNALRLGTRSRASRLLSEIRHGNRSLKTYDFVHILEYCARSPDPLFVMETWRIMREKEVDMDNKCYLLIIRALCKGGHVEEAFNLMNTLGDSLDLHPILPMYNDILGGFAQSQNLSCANECLDLMERQMVGKNEVTYTQLVKLAVSQRNLSAVHEIWMEHMKYYSPSLISLRKFIWSFSQLGDLKAAYESLQKMVVLTLRGGFVLSKTAGGKLFISRLDIPMPSRCKLDLKGFNQDNEDAEHSTFMDSEKLETCVSKSEDGSMICPRRDQVEDVGLRMLRGNHTPYAMEVLRLSFNDVMHACARNSDCRLAEQLFEQMQDLGLEPSCSTYDAFVRAVVTERGFRDGIEVLEMMQQKNLKPFDSTVAAIAISCCKALDIDLAEALLDHNFKSPTARPYNAFLEACDTLDQPERAIHTLAKMKRMKIQPDIRTYELLFSLFGNYNPPYEKGNMFSRVDVAKRMHAIEMDMVKNGIQHSRTSMKNMLEALGAEGMVKELIQYLHTAENQFSRCLGTPIYNVVLHSLVEAKEGHMAIEIFESMKSCGFLPDAATYNIMIDCCSIIRCFRSACALVSLMMRNGFHVQALTYTTLIKILLGNGDIDEALNLLDQGSIEGIQFDVFPYDIILRAACEKGRIDVVELIAERMHQNRVQPDPLTCNFVFSAYVDRDYINTAMEALQVLSMRMISQEDGILEEKRTEFEENFIFAEDSEVESRIIELFKDFKEDLAVALLNLRWCATLGCQISWLPNQSLWARRLSSNYGLREGVA